MVSLRLGRLLSGVGLFGLLIAFARVSGDEVACYQSITELPCPSATGSFDTCDVQFVALPAAQKKWESPFDKNGPSGTAFPNCEKITYTARNSGPWGDGAKTPCLTVASQTGTKCIPVIDGNGVVLREQCGEQFKCVWSGEANGCVKDVTKTTPPFFADKYKLDATGCKKSSEDCPPPP